MITLLKKIDRFLDKYAPLFLLFCLLLLLRLPNLTEPVWHIQESLSLLVGVAFRHGQKLYADIALNNTPLFYFFTRVPSYLWFRIMLIVVSSINTLLFFFFASRFFQKMKAVYLSTLTFILFTSSPLFAGHRFSSETFGMMFLLLGSWTFFSWIREPKKFSKVGWWTGVFFALAALTNIHFVFDILAFTLLFAFSHKNESLRPFFKGFGVTFAVFIVYFLFRGTLVGFLSHGIMTPLFGTTNETSSLVLRMAFSQFGKVLLLVLGAVLLARQFRTNSHQLQLKEIATQPLFFFFVWFVLSIIGSLWIGVTYINQFLPALIPFALIVGIWVDQQRGKRKSIKTETIEMLSLGRKSKETPMKQAFYTMVACMLLLVGIFYVAGVRTPLRPNYYTQFWKLYRRKISLESYRNTFGTNVQENYQTAKKLRRMSSPYIFVLNSDPALYALSNKLPWEATVDNKPLSLSPQDYSRDTQAKQYLPQLMADEVPYIVTGPTESLSLEMSSYLSQYYMPTTELTHLILWKRIPS